MSDLLGASPVWNKSFLNLARAKLIWQGSVSPFFLREVFTNSDMGSKIHLVTITLKDEANVNVCFHLILNKSNEKYLL